MLTKRLKNKMFNREMLQLEHLPEQMKILKGRRKVTAMNKQEDVIPEESADDERYVRMSALRLWLNDSVLAIPTAEAY